MGVTCVIQYPVPDGKSGQPTVEMLQKRLELLGAEKTGLFSVECDLYQAQIPNVTTRLAHVFTCSDQPASCFTILDTGTCLVADNLFTLLIMKVKDYYVQKKNAKVESKGQKYILGDFVIKIGSVSVGRTLTFKGILIEVEYRPCDIPGECWNLMKEFIQGFTGNSMDIPPNVIKTRMDALFTPSDTIMQYMEQFNGFRKAMAQQPPMPHMNR